MHDLPETGMIVPFTHQLQTLRDTCVLVVTSKKVELITNGVIRMPTVLRKSYDEHSISDAFIIPGFTDSKRQGVDLDSVFASYKLTQKNDQKKKWINDLPIIVRSVLKRGRILEKEFDELDYPIDTDSDPYIGRNSQIEKHLQSLCSSILHA